MALRARKVAGAFEKRAPDLSSESCQRVDRPWERWLFLKDEAREFAVSQAPRISSRDCFPSLSNEVRPFLIKQWIVKGWYKYWLCTPSSLWKNYVRSWAPRFDFKRNKFFSTEIFLFQVNKETVNSIFRIKRSETPEDEIRVRRQERLTLFLMQVTIFCKKAHDDSW